MSSSEDLVISRKEFKSSDNSSEVTINIAVPHMRLMYRSKKENMKRISELVKQSKEENNIHIFLIPSGFTGGPFLEHRRVSINMIKKISERIPGQLTSELKDIARENNVYLITGGFYEKAGPRIFISSVVISPFQEDIIYRYRKMNLGEEELSIISAGKEPCVIEISGLKIGILLEEDLFVPDIARALVLNRSDLLIIFSKLSNRFSEIIKYLAIARAVENNIPVINIGGLLNIAGDEIINVKTFIVKSNGSIEGESDEDEEIFYMTVRLKDPARRGIKKIPGMEVSRNVIKYIRRNKLL